MAKNDSTPQGNLPDSRLHQHSGSENASDGYEKVNHHNGTFSMRPTDD